MRHLSSLKCSLFVVLFVLGVTMFLSGEALSLELSSTSFSNGGDIPVRYTGRGVDISPEMTWRDVPEGTESFVLISDDPDAPMGSWIHWVVYDIPADVTGLEEDVPSVDVLDNGARQGTTSFGSIGYGGPAPPPGPPHRYIFTLYAVDKKLGLPSGAGKKEVLNAIKGHVLAQAEYMGLFGS